MDRRIFNNLFFYEKIVLMISLILFCVLPITVKAEDVIYNFDYSGKEEVLEIKYGGWYKVEVWGGQGGYGLCNGSRCGSALGYGGYSEGVVFLKRGEKLYINVGGKGTNGTYRVNSAGGYNGGGNGSWDGSDDESSAGGGGATHIAFESGLLKELSDKIDQVLIVAGGGGGSSWSYTAGAGGGYRGATNSTTNPTEVSQTTGYAFGQGQNASGAADSDGVGGGGGGWYGGYMYNSSGRSSGSGGSGYIASERLISYNDTTKKMYCYNCPTSTDANTYTVTTTNVSATATSEYAKIDNGYARITLVHKGNTNANLSNIEITGATASWDKTFNSNTYEYTLTFGTEDKTINIKGIPEENVTTVDPEELEYDIPVGTSSVSLISTSESGDILIYKLNIKRNASNYPYLKSISIDGEEIKGFSPTKLEYDINVPYYVETIDIGSISGRTNQIISKIGKVNLKTGSQTYEITSKSEDKTNIVTYKINVFREHSAYIKELSIKDYQLTNEYKPETLTYDIDVLSSDISLDINPILYDEQATYTIKDADFMINQNGTITITVTEPNSITKTYTINYHKISAQPKDLTCSNDYEEYIVPFTGLYKLEVWGAQGGGSQVNGNGNLGVGGKGGYSTGTINLKYGTKLYLYAGCQGGVSNGGLAAGGFNGGGSTWASSNGDPAGGGGGASDIRLYENSLYNRVIVAGGGGGGGEDSEAGGCGGGERGCQGASGTNAPGTQTSGTAGGVFGYGANTPYDGGGGGGGWYGGGTSGGSQTIPTGNSGSDANGGSGGSGFVFKQSTAINVPTDYQLTENDYLDNEAYTVNGNTEMPSHDGLTTMTGNTGNGYVKVTLISQSKNNYLSELKTDVGTLVPEFDPRITNYEITVNKYVSEITVDGEVSDINSTVTGFGTYELPIGDTIIISIPVTSESGDIRVYKIAVTREALAKGEHSTKLATLVLSDNEFETNPKFESETTEYTIEIPDTIISIPVETSLYDKESNVQITGNGYIKPGKNGLITITVTSPYVSSTVYKIKVVREGGIEEAEYGYNFTGKEEIFTAPVSGYYKLETWGAQGGYGLCNGGRCGGAYGYGGYASGAIKLKKGDQLYINVGSKGQDGTYRVNAAGGYNGGGNGSWDGRDDESSGGGGGATSIATTSGLLSTLENKKDQVIIVAGGGGGSSWTYTAGAGGGFRGATNGTTNPTEVSQTTGYAFGQGQNASGAADSDGVGGGGGGWYGGYMYNYSGRSSGSGGSGYIGNNQLVSYRDTVKNMYCYNCLESTEEDTYTISTTKYSALPTSNYAKSGDGYVRITKLEDPSTNNFLSFITLSATRYDNDEVSDKEISPSFNMEVTDYYVTLNDMETIININAKLEDSRASIDGLGEHEVPAGTTTYPITVTAESGDVKTYNIHVTRPANNNPFPDNVIINGLVPSLCSADSSYCFLKDESNNQVSFDNKTHTYYLTVPSRIKQLYFNVELGHPYQAVNGEGRVSLKGGDNNITITVKSEAALDKADTSLVENVDYSVYNFIVVRDMTGNTDLEEFVILDPNRDINYNPDITEYYVSVPNEYDKWQLNNVNEKQDYSCPEDSEDCIPQNILQLFIKTDDENATYIITDKKELEVGMNEIDVLVTAANGETKTYILNVYREKNENVYLSSLEVSNNTTIYSLIPEFNKIITGTYYVTVPNDIDTVNVNGTPEVNTTIVLGNGEYELFTTKANKVTITTTAENGTTEIYTLSITREKNNNNDLTNIIISDDNKNYELKPEFDKEILSYNVTVDEGVNKVNIVANTLKDTTNYRLLDNTSIKVGNNVKRIMAIAEDGTSKIYTINIYRPASTNNYLSDLIVKNGDKQFELSQLDESGIIGKGFDKENNKYQIEVENDIKTINVNGIKDISLSTVKGNGNYSLSVGENNISINVTNEAGETRTYTLTVIRKPNSNAYLKSITTSEGIIVPEFNKEEQKYVVNIENNVSSFSITAIADVNTTSINGGLNNISMMVNDIPSGTTEFKFVTLAEDGVTSLTYIVEVVKDKSDNDNLSYLIMEEGALDKAFNSDIIIYNTIVPYSVTKGTFHIELEDENASYEILNNNFDVGDNEVIIRVTSESGMTKDYTVNVNRQELESSNNYLSNITVNKGTLTPTFNKEKQYYEVEVDYSITQIQVDAKLEDSSSSLTGTGVYTLNVGHNLAILKVKGADGSIRDYQVLIDRKKNTEARLSQLAIESTNLTPEFNKDNYEYTVTTSDPKLTFTRLIPIDSNATYEIIGNENFITGSDSNEVKIRVTAQDGITQKEYKIHVNKEASANYYLSNLEVEGFDINPNFNRNTTLYNLTVSSDIKTVNVIAIPEDINSIVSGTGTQTLTVGTNYVTVEVKSELGNTRMYTIVITKEGSTNNYASRIDVKNGTMNPEYDKTINTYDVVVPYEEKQIDFDIELEDENASYTILNNDLKVGNNTVTVSVTAENGSINNYVFNVVREEAISALLENIKFKNYHLTPEFNSYINNYQLFIDNEIDKLSLLNMEIIPIDKKATYIINGNENLAIGSNVVTIEVTSSNGIDKETYTINIERQAYSNNFLDYLYTDQGDLEPVFNKTKMEYSVNVPYDVKTITLFGEPVDKSNTISSIGDKVSGNLLDGEIGTFNLNTGDNLITVVVTSTTGIKRTYYINVNRAKDSDNYLTSLTAKVGTTKYELTPTFDKTIYDYQVTVPVGTNNINLSGTLSSPNAKVTGLGITKLIAGQNEIKINVTSEDGAIRTYTVIVTREASTNNRLIELVPQYGVLIPSFNYDLTDYTIMLDSSVSFEAFDVITEDENATVSGNERQLVPDGISTRTIEVKSESGDIRTYNITLNKARTDNAHLEDLNVIGYELRDKEGNLTTFDRETFDYYINVENEKTTLLSQEVIATLEDKNSSISKPKIINLVTTSDNEYIVKVTAPDGSTTLAYTIHVNRAKSNIAKLESLKVNVGTLDQVFNSEVTSYTWTVPKNTVITKENVLAIAAENGTVSQTEKLIVNPKENNVYEIVVTSEDETQSLSYFLNVVLDLSADATLKSITVDKGTMEPIFDSEVYVYDVYEYVDVEQIEVTAITNSENSEITSGNGIVPLVSDVTQHEIVITAEDGSTETYVLNIHKSILKDESLEDLYLNGLDINEDIEEKTCIDDKCVLSPLFNKDVINYSIKVPYEYQTLDVYYEKMNDQQTVKIKVGNEYVTDYKLPLGKTDVLVEVYDGFDKLTKTYTINIERCKSNNSYLSDLIITNGLDEEDTDYVLYPLEPDFDKHTQEYTIYVDKNVNEVTINATTENPTSYKFVNGYNYLQIGENIATVDVIAADGSSERTYIIHIIKASEYNSYIKNITLSTGIFWDLTPKFKPTVFEYSTTIASTNNKATVEAVPVDPTTTITGTGEYDLVTGNNVVRLISTAAGDGSISVYTININKLASSNVDLQSLIVEEGNLKPDFDKGITKYDVTVDNNVTKLNIHAIPEDLTSTVKITGNENLITGNNIISIIVTSEDKTVSKTYQLNVYKKYNSNANLENIKVYDDKQEYPIEPEFKEDVLEYTSFVPSNIEKANISAITSSPYSIITGTGEVYLDYGNNNFEITVTAEDGTINVYQLNVYKEYNLNLSTLVSDKGTLNPIFNKDITEYTIDLNNTEDEITFVALTDSNKTTVTGSGTYELHTGENVIIFTVSDPDGHTKEYKVIVNRAKDNNNYIKELTVKGILTPAFDKNTQEYQIDVRESTKSLEDLNYVLESKTATAKVVGNESFSKDKNPNVVVIRVTAEDGTTRDYKFNVMLQPDEYFSNRLSSLTIDSGTLTPDFAPDINNYAVTVSNSVNELNIEAIPENERAIVTGDGNIKLNVGRNVIPIKVRSQDGLMNEYDLIVYRTEPNDATLQSLVVSGHDYIPIFSKLTENYEMEIASEVDNLDIIANPTDSSSTVKITGNKNLVSGDNLVKVIVTAPDKITTKTYTIKVTKSVSKNNYLSNLNVTGYDFTNSFIKTNQGPYVINVPSNINSIMINAIPEAKTSTIDGDGIAKLVGGKNIITVRVTAESGDTRDYTIIVNKALSTDSTLKDILLSDESLDPVFNPSTHEYTVNVPEELDSITITGIVNDSSATITGNGTYDVYEDFIVDLVVTAEDGNKTTYKVNIHRDIPASSYLKQLIVKDGELYPGFHKLITNYTILVPNEVRSLNMTYAPEDENATVAVTGNENFKVGTNKVHIVVTATDGTSTDYELAVVRQTIASNYLKSLSVEGYTLNPVFNKTNMYYEVTVPEDVDKVKIKATAEDPSSTLSGTGYKSLKVGNNITYVTVESTSGVIRTYQILIKRTASSENYLLTLESDVGTLDPVFDKEINAYTLRVPDKTTQVTFSGTASENSIVNGLGTYEVSLGETTRAITVTSQSGEVNTYTINVIRGASTNTNLNDLVPSTGTITPEYSNDVLEYRMEVEDTVNVINFIASPEDESATITTDDIMVLAYGKNEYHVKVVAEDGITERNITIIINRKKDLISIEASEKKIFLDIDDTYNLSYKINPVDTTYPEVEWKSNGTTIATVDETGKIKAVGYGSTTIQVVSKHDNTIYDTVNVIVMSKKISSSVYTIDRESDKDYEYIIGLEPKTVLKSFISNLDNEETMIHVYDYERKEIDDTSYIGTSFIVTLEFEDEVLDELTIIVRGDLNSDGDITTADYVKMKNYILKKIEFNRIEMLAGDLTKSSSIGTTDYVKLKNYILKKINSVN